MKSEFLNQPACLFKHVKAQKVLSQTLLAAVQRNNVHVWGRDYINFNWKKWKRLTKQKYFDAYSSHHSQFSDLNRLKMQYIQLFFTQNDCNTLNTCKEKTTQRVQLRPTITNSLNKTIVGSNSIKQNETYGVKLTIKNFLKAHKKSENYKILKVQACTRARRSTATIDWLVNQSRERDKYILREREWVQHQCSNNLHMSY